MINSSLQDNSLSIPEPDVITGQSSPIPYFFVGDSAFPLKHVKNVSWQAGTCLHENKQIFNYGLSRTRRIIENTFGILATKFRIFRRPIIAKPEKVTKITQTECALYNYLKISEMLCSRIYCPPGYIN